MKYRVNQDKSWTLKDLEPENIDEAHEEYRKKACWRPDLKEKPTVRLPFPVLRSYWLKLAEEQEDKRVKGKEMYYTIKVYDDESVLEHISLGDKEPIEGIILRTLTWKFPKNQVLDKRSLRLIARSNTRRLTSDELKIAYPKLCKRENEYQEPDKTYLYSVQEMRRCFIDIPTIGYQRANKEISKNLIHFTKRANPDFTIILGDSDY